MNQRDDVLKLASSYIGLKDNPKGKNIFNTKYYGRETIGSNYAWCCVFVWFLFQKLGLSHLFYNGNKTASCTTLLTYYKNNGMVTTNPMPGDLVFYNFDKNKSNSEHIGIFEKWNDSNTFTAIEGNTSLNNNANGGQVMRRSRNKSLVLAFVHIPYANEKPVKTTNPYKEPTSVVKYSKLTQYISKESVKWVQWELVQAGHKIVIDGRFGSATLSAIKGYQKSKGLVQDGMVGPATRRCMKQ